MLPKKKYLDKVRKRAEEMIPLLEDYHKLHLVIKMVFFSDVESLSRKISIPKREITPGELVPLQELHNLAEHLRMLIMSDVPSLLDAVEGMYKIEKES